MKTPAEILAETLKQQLLAERAHAISLARRVIEKQAEGERILLAILLGLQDRVARLEKRKRR